MRLRHDSDLHKTLSFAVIHLAIAVTLGWLFTGGFVLGGLLALVEPGANTAVSHGLEKWAQRWRGLARLVPIAVISRPGYDDEARAARAMGWLRRFVRPASQARNWTEWSVPAISFLRLPPDRTSATSLRALNPDWHRRFISKLSRAVHP